MGLFRPLGLLTALALLATLNSLPAPSGGRSFGNPRPVPQFGLFYAGISGSENERRFDATQDIVTDTIGTIHIEDEVDFDLSRRSFLLGLQVEGIGAVELSFGKLEFEDPSGRTIDGDKAGPDCAHLRVGGVWSGHRAPIKP